MLLLTGLDVTSASIVSTLKCHTMKVMTSANILTMFVIISLVNHHIERCFVFIACFYQNRPLSFIHYLFTKVAKDEGGVNMCNRDNALPLATL